MVCYDWSLKRAALGKNFGREAKFSIWLLALVSKTKASSAIIMFGFYLRKEQTP